jgi:CRP/FNR family cyclic AMP-dependent transcriptional regulator
VGDAFDPAEFVAAGAGVRSSIAYRAGHTVFSQGDPADSVFYVVRGTVKASVTSEQGKEGVVAVLGPGDFFGEVCLTAEPLRLITVQAMTDATIVRVEKAEMIRLLHAEPGFADLFTAHLLTRNSRVEADLVDQLFHTIEQRLARTLLLLAKAGKGRKPSPIPARITQETLAEMVGATRPRVSFFMNKFRKAGFIEYDKELKVHSSLLRVLLHD